MTVQRTLESETVQAAQSEAEEILAEARREADELVKHAHEEADKARHETRQASAVLHWKGAIANAVATKRNAAMLEEAEDEAQRIRQTAQTEVRWVPS